MKLVGELFILNVADLGVAIRLTGDDGICEGIVALQFDAAFGLGADVAQ